MKKKYFIWAGALLLLTAVGVANSGDFISHYGHVVQKTAAGDSGISISPLEINTVSPDYFSLVTEPADGTPPILSRIENAKTSVDLVMYALDDTQVEQALGAAVARGVKVRVLLNGGYYDTKEPANDASYAALQKVGVPVEWTPTSFALTHQKTLVLDGNDALIMTFNLQTKYYTTGRDFAVDDTDSNDVAAIEKTFDADWEGTPQNEGIAGQGDDLVWSPGSEDEMLYLINSATSTLKIYNEEMDDTDITNALVAAAKRGVQVQVDMTYATDWRPAFTQLENGGVEVRTFASSSKIIYIHAKMILADGARVFLGSENFSDSSLNKNRELGLVLTSPMIIGQLNATFDSDWVRARPFVIPK